MQQTYKQLCSWENLWFAWKKAAQGKRGKHAAADFEYRLEDNLFDLRHDLIQKQYTPGEYCSFYIHEPKRRLISAAPFRDRVVHHALCQIVGPQFERSFIFDSYANRIGKGTHRALDRAQQFARKYKYVLQCDVKQFFPAIDHAILRKILARKIIDPDILWLIDQILASGDGVLSESYDMHYFPDDDLFAKLRPRGLPIGNQTSQFWANVYLNPFDHFVKRELGCKAYLRYVDDTLIFADDKRKLWEWRSKIIERLQKFRLIIHERSAQVKPAAEGISFLGFVIYPTHRRLKRRKGIYYRRTLKKLLASYHDGIISFEQLNASIQGWINHVRYGDTWGLRRAILRPIKISNAGRRNEAGHGNLYPDI